MSLPAVGTETTRAIRPHRTFEGHTGHVKDVIHLPGEQQIMTSSDIDSSLRMWNLKTGEQIGKGWRNTHAVGPIASSFDGKRLVSTGGGNKVRLWDIGTGEVITEWTGHTSAARTLCWNRNGGRVLSGSQDWTARVWDVESGETILAIKAGLSVDSAIYSPDETIIATGGWGNGKEHIKVFDAKTGKLIAILEGHTRGVKCLAWTADGTTLISGSFDKSIRTWNTTTWQQIDVFTGHTSSVQGIAISPSGRILASASWDKTARLWNIENGQPIASPLQHANNVDCVSFSTDGKLLATGCWDHNAYTWDISTIFRETGFDECLLNPKDDHKSSLEENAT